MPNNDTGESIDDLIDELEVVAGSEILQVSLAARRDLRFLYATKRAIEARTADVASPVDADVVHSDESAPPATTSEPGNA